MSNAVSPQGPTGVLAPLHERVFRLLWGATFVANLTMSSNEVASAWLMTHLTDQAVLVALVQSAATLPVFLLGLPSGALADILDRRRYYAITQLWVCVVATILAALALADALTAHGLLVLTFANGVAVAMRWPVFAAIVPDVVPRERLPAALALNAISINITRIVGPMVAGFLLTGFGPEAVFGLNAVLAMVSVALILQWRSVPKTSALPGERFVGAMRVGVQHLLQAPHLRVIVIKIFLAFAQAAAMTSLMPLMARGWGWGAGGFTLLLASMAVGAIVASTYVARLRSKWSFNQLVRGAFVAQILATLAMAFTPNLGLGCLVSAWFGGAAVVTANTLTVSIQLALPDWVRARGMSAYQMSLMGGSALGAALWGQIANVSSVPTSLKWSAVLGLLALAGTWRMRVVSAGEVDVTPARIGSDPVAAIPVEPDDGPVMVTVEYRVDPADAAAFREVMLETRAARLRQGALSWGLFNDVAVPGRVIEYFVDESWIEHLRRQERFTAADALLRERRLAFHRGDEPPAVQRYVGQTLRNG